MTDTAACYPREARAPFQGGKIHARRESQTVMRWHWRGLHLTHRAIAVASVLLLSASATLLGVRAETSSPAPIASAPVIDPSTVAPVVRTPRSTSVDPPVAHVSFDASPYGCAARTIPGIGPACAGPNGLHRVLLADGSTVDTHGGDPLNLSVLAGKATSGSLDIFQAAVAPPCATDTARDFQMRAIYAVPSDRADRSRTVASRIRETIARTNGALRVEAPTTIAGFRFRCTRGTVDVARAILPTRASRSTFATVVNDLRAAGFRSTHEKYVIFLDMNLPCGCSGLGSFHTDDRASLDNVSNTGPDYAVLMQLAMDMPEVALHEIGHTLGAVQLSSRDSSGAGHCNDGFDVMCYNDGGPHAAYKTSACTVTRFDCGGNDYFNPDPAAGSYLATHWNLASRFDRYIVFRAVNHPPVVSGLVCDPSPSEANETVTCSFSIADDSPAVTTVVDWGDGAKTESDPVAPGAFTEKHAWATDGAHVVRVVATDESISSAPAVFSHRVATCALSSAGTLTLGLRGTGVDGVDAITIDGISTGCGGYPYSLATDAANGIDICWFADATQLSCSSDHAAAVKGTVPTGATKAKLILYSGVMSAYTLRAPVRSS